MPIYAYKCGACGFAKDVLQKMSDAPLSVCPSCGASAFSKQLTAAGFQLKGSGWYVTDFRDGKDSKASKGADKAESGEGKSAETAAPAADSGAGKSADTAAAPAASKPAAAAAASAPAAAPSSKND
ncbi:MAG: zinc ribbon domain-containing protein [Gammaproteobacteria bacterium]|nr:zinc ribbon domain-containing protein [Gammaproteobacteria bacterium]MBU1440495.1 zinc ribbon domain-containing protein [Gammaproteobacteria bacterium]MBU2286485.1 zinc ribbon domain-containing protein [Gammaproteobacteria bacterium]